VQWSNKRKDLYILNFCQQYSYQLNIHVNPVVNLLNSSNKNVIQTFGREPFSQPNFIRAPNSLPRHSPFFLFLFVFMLDLCVHSAIDIFNFRVDLINKSCPKACPSTYKCGHKQQFLIFFLKREIYKNFARAFVMARFWRGFLRGTTMPKALKSRG